MGDYQNLRLDVDGSIATITIDRQEKLNALDRTTLNELARAVAWIQDNDKVRGAIVTGAGTKAFVAGADIGELQRMTATSGVELSRLGQDVFRRIELSKKPFLAAINGFALGGGCELALACHLRLASTEAKLGLPEIKLGLIPGYGGTVRLPRLIGRGRALEMILTGEMIGAEEAFRIGLVNRLCTPDLLTQESQEMLGRVIVNAPVALAYAIEAGARGSEMATDEALGLESHLFGLLGSTEDLREGVAAFLEKRKPVFRGR
jgi:enoyl-CoA hydratase